MAETFILVPGRTSKQGCGVSEGKFTDGYQKEISSLQVADEVTPRFPRDALTIATPYAKLLFALHVLVDARQHVRLRADDHALRRSDRGTEDA